jgi:hypothetical protein
MVSRVACLETAFAKSFRFPENTRQGASPFLILAPIVSWTGCGADVAGEHVHVVKERKMAKSLFVMEDGRMTALADTMSTTVSSKASKTAITIDEPKPAASQVKAGRLMSKEDADKVRQAIREAKTAEEVRRLERQLREGYMPSVESVGA